MIAPHSGEAITVPNSISTDLSEYERLKFELADIVRYASARVSRNSDPIYAEFLDFFARLGEDRFNLVVAGRFSRGKTSLMNAILGLNRLPTGIVPLTSVITTVGYGSSENVQIELQRGGLPFKIRMEEIGQYITERGNPGNTRGIRQAKIQLPVEILRRGFYFVDTPGLGSSIAENTQTALAFLPEADALLLVSGYDSPLSDDELRVLRTMASTKVQVFFVLNKQDTVAPEARHEVIDYVTAQLKGIFGESPPPIFSTSAIDGLEAKLNQRLDNPKGSGLWALEEALTQFLIQNKRHHFLIRMFDRATHLVNALVPDAATTQLKDQLTGLKSTIEAHDSNSATLDVSTATAVLADAAPQVQRCETCERIKTTLFEFLCHYQSALVVDSRERGHFVADGGFCAQHMWLYESIAAPRDLCVALAPLLTRLSDGFRRQASRGPPDPTIAVSSPLAEPSCQLCKIQRNIEAEVISDLGRRGNATELPTLCIPHLRLITGRLENSDLIGALLTHQAHSMDRLAEDMRRYALKFDGLRRWLMSEEERRAPDDALAYLAGRRSIIR
jgi:GTP-binding protein EngB required for normal cell division